MHDTNSLKMKYEEKWVKERERARRRKKENHRDEKKPKNMNKLYTCIYFVPREKTIA